MAVPEWLFGPAGDLRPLPSPDADVGNSVDRFGGTHVAINGGRTLDTFGYRASYEFELPFMEEKDHFRLEALYTLAVPGSLRLIDPLRRNLLTRESAMAKPSDAFQRGLYTTFGPTLEWTRASNSPVEWTSRAALWENLSDNSFIRFDRGDLIPATSDQMTFSVYVKCSDTMDLEVTLDTFTDGEEGAGISGVVTAIPAGEWIRLETVFTVPETVHELHPVLWVRSVPPAGSSVQIVAPQFETGPTATSASLGGGALTVVINEMDSISPRYPLQSVTLSLLEV